MSAMISNLRLPLLLTGITGVAGFNAFHYFRKCYPGHVVGIRPRKTWRLTGRGIVGQDAEDGAGLAKLFAKHRFGSVLNCAGYCALKACELNPEMAKTINVASAQVMAQLVRQFDCRLVHLSIDLVFSGTRGGDHIETDPVDPVTVYGKTMAEGERIIANNYPPAAILRISLPMGPSFNRHAGAIDWIDSRFRAGRPATLYFDELRCAAYCDDLNPVFERFLCGEENGIWHLGGPKTLTLYQIGQIVNRVGGYEPKLLKGCPRIMAGPIPPRAGDVSMCSGKLIQRLGKNPFRPWPVESELWPSNRQWHAERKGGVKGSFEGIKNRLYQSRLPFHDT